MNDETKEVVSGMAFLIAFALALAPIWHYFVIWWRYWNP